MIVVTGGSGQLGTAFRRLLPEALFPSHRDLDLTAQSSTWRVLDEVRPATIINCASYNAVDQAEDDEVEATAVNGNGVARLVEYCRARGLRLITFSTDTSLAACSIVLGFVGVGMGFVSMATLLVVQDSLGKSDLGVATASQQFFRTLGGTIGVGISGSFVTMTLSNVMESLLRNGLNNLPPSLNVQIKQSIENTFRPEVQALLTPDIQKTMQEAVARGVSMVFWITFFASLLCLILIVLIPFTDKR